VLGDDPVAMLKEIGEDVQSLRLERAHPARVPKLITVGIERIRVERVDHRDTPTRTGAQLSDSRNSYDTRTASRLASAPRENDHTEILMKS
jgi:hypothetical protein